jgi:dihydroorotase
MEKLLILNAKIINEGIISIKDVLISNGKIEKIADNLSHIDIKNILDLTGKYLMPGVIDDQVHFREPGLTEKGNIESESKAAVAGGTTSFMEMPNTIPNALTQTLLEDKYQIAARSSWANYSFFMGGSNDNYEEVMKTDLKNICGLKLFMGSSTGNMLVDNKNTLQKLFSSFSGLIATHCEDEQTVVNNLNFYKEKYKNTALPYDIHAIIRNEEACLKSSAMAVEMAKKNNTRLHILHISTTEELSLFTNSVPLKDKKITSEVCVHHLYFDANDYKKLGNKIKCNPAIKHGHKENLFAALLDGTLDIIATDHAPHELAHKTDDYWHAHSGLPLVQHGLLIMLDFYKKGKISLEKIVEKMCHAPAQCFNINDRGYIKEGYWADLVVINLEDTTTVTQANTYYKVGWTPFSNHTFNSAVETTIINGNIVYNKGLFNKIDTGKRLTFNN